MSGHMQYCQGLCAELSLVWLDCQQVLSWRQLSSMLSRHDCHAMDGAYGNQLSVWQQVTEKSQSMVTVTQDAPNTLTCGVIAL